MFEKNIFSMLNMAKKIAQKEEDPENFGYSDEGVNLTPQQEYGTETGVQEMSPEDLVRPKLQTEEIGLTEFEIEEIQSSAVRKGLEAKYLPTLTALIDSINEEIKGETGVKGYHKPKKEGLREIENYVKQLLEVQTTGRSSQPSLPVETTEPEIIEEGEPEETGETDTILGFTPYEIEQIEEYAVKKGLNTELLPNLDEIIDAVNEKINSGVITKDVGTVQINEQVTQLFDAQKNKPAETKVPTETENILPEEKEDAEDDEDVLLDISTEDISPTFEREIDPDTGLPVEDPSIDRYEEKDKAEYKGISPQEAAERAKSLVLSGKPEDYINEDISEYPVSYEIGGKVMAKTNVFRITPQAEKMVEVFGAHNLVRNRAFEKACRGIQKGLRNNYYINDMPMDEIAATLYRNILNSLALVDRYDRRSGKLQRYSDNRLRAFAKTPELVPPELQGEWEKLQEMFDADLLAKQKLQLEQIARGKRTKPPQQKINTKTKDNIMRQSGFGPKFVAALDKLINSADPRVLIPVYKEAARLSSYELGYRQQGGKKERPDIVIEDESGSGGTSVTEQSDKSTRENISGNEVVDVKQNKESFYRSSRLVSSFIDDVWSDLGASTNDPEDYSKFDKIRLKMELFKQNSEELLGPTGKADTTIDRVYNDNGQIIWQRKKPKQVFVTLPVKQPDGSVINEKTSVAFDDSMKDVVSKNAFYKNYVDFLRLKHYINQISNVPGLDKNNPQWTQEIKQRVLAKDATFANPVFKAFLDDPKFINMTARQDGGTIATEYAKVSADPKQAGLIDTGFGVIWGTLAADSLIAVAKKTKQLQKDLTGKTDIEKKKAIEDFVRARQSYIAMINVHSTLLDEASTPKLGANGKLYKLFGVKLQTRDILQMIAGFKPIPPEIMERMASHKYNLANKIYNNMMQKIARMIKINNNFIKLSSNNKPIFNIESVINDAMRQIRLIMDS